MDKINVTDEALRNAYMVLQRLGNSADGITEQCVSALSSQLGGLDTAFREDISRYISLITALKQKVRNCIDENIGAIGERFSKIPDYERQTYKKRTMA